MTYPKTIVVATHRRSGTHWTIDALRNNSPDVSETFLTLERASSHHDSPIPLSEFRRQLKTLDGRVLVKVHDLPAATFWKRDEERAFALSVLRESPVIYVHRDGRDVMVSLYYYMQSFDEEVKKQSFSDFIRSESRLDGFDSGMSRPAYWAHHARVWLQQPNVLLVSYAGLENCYETSVREMAAFLGISARRSLRAIDLPGKTSKPSLVGRALWKLGLRQQRLSSAVQPRRGSSGDWRNHFDDDDLAFFMAEAGEQMRQLGNLKK
ncbi:MAG: sulfotransferase domain-containing protein [Chloroflexota bacterium]|nr:sulfotransferase domain-containing protein [Chloroflexota bacterium]